MRVEDSIMTVIVTNVGMVASEETESVEECNKQ